MIADLSQNTQAVLLLAAPLIARRDSSSSEILTPGEYKRLARLLRTNGCQPADLLSEDAERILQLCETVVESDRLRRLLGRGYLLSQVIEHWRARAIWVVSRADDAYPQRLKRCLKEDAPVILYGCGNQALVNVGGLAVVGSRHVEDWLVEYTVGVGNLAANAGKGLISGGARGIDQAAMRGAIEGGGKVCGVLANNLERAAMNRENRDSLINDRLVLVSPYDPRAGFNVGNAMQRNKLIYALADAALVVSSDFNRGGTWNGATEQLDKLRFVPVYVRSTGEASKGLDALVAKGAMRWPNPEDKDALAAALHVENPCRESVERPLFTEVVNSAETGPTDSCDEGKCVDDAFHKSVCLSSEDQIAASVNGPAQTLLDTVRDILIQLLKSPLKDADVAEALGVSTPQARTWLKRFVDEGTLEKRNRPVRYVVSSQASLLEAD